MNGFAIYPTSFLFLYLMIALLAFLFLLATFLLHFTFRTTRWSPYYIAGWLAQALGFSVGIIMTLVKIPEPFGLAFLSLSFVPLLLSIVQLILVKSVWWITLLDDAALLLLLPFYQGSRGMAYGALLAVLYLLGRSLFYFFYTYLRSKHGFGFYVIKDALDDLPNGLLIAGKDGRVLYLNKAFLDFLGFFGIDPHHKEDRIFVELRWLSFRLVDPQSLVLAHEGHYYLVREILRGKQKEMSVQDVDAEIALNTKLHSTNLALQKQKDLLLAMLDRIKLAAQGQAKENLRRLVHDSFAEEVSLIHQVLINPSVNDLRPLKELVRRGMLSYELTYEDLEELEGFYALLGVHFVNDGPFENCPDKPAVLEAVREASDNAIRHGNADEITLHSYLEAGHFYLRISNNGADPSSFVFHNGLTHLQNRFINAGGNLQVEMAPHFALLASLPLPKG